MDSTKRKKYESFCHDLYVPIYSKPWWMDVVCGSDNWDVWFYDNGGSTLAAMPYYLADRNGRKYITKAPLTQNNGILFKHANNAKLVSRSILEEKVIDAACEYIRSLELDVYEQQYQTSFTNWLPFFWNYYSSITRYTYIFDDTSNLDSIWNGISSKRRSIIRKGQKNSKLLDYGMSNDEFYRVHNQIYEKQGLECPFSHELWSNLAEACSSHDAGKVMYRVDEGGHIAAVSFVVWDNQSLYKLMGGPIPEYAKLDAYSALTWDEIELAHQLGVAYDFEGSVIKRISKSFREYGATPKPYFRIRKVFNPDIIREEAEECIRHLSI